MRYESKKTEKGNVGVSFSSQEAADLQATEMDKNNCSDCSGCSDCSRCSGCYDCSRCSDCYGCSDCSGIIGWKGGEAGKLIALNGLTWPVSTDGKKIQIGCQCHSVADWEAFDDERIKIMDIKALEFWKASKPTIMAMAAYRASLGDDE